MVDNNGDGGGRAVIDCLKDEGGPMEIETEEQWPVEAVEDFGAEIAEDEGHGNDQVPEVEDEAQQCTPEEDPRAPKELGAVGPIAEVLGMSTVVGGSTVSGSGGGSASGSGGGSGVEQSGSSPRDSARGKRVLLWRPRKQRRCPLRFE